MGRIVTKKHKELKSIWTLNAKHVIIYEVRVMQNVKKFSNKKFLKIIYFLT